MAALKHDFPFDPTYGYGPPELLMVAAPEEPGGFADYWRERFAAAVQLHPNTQWEPLRSTEGHWELYRLSYTSTGGFTIHGWALVPRSGRVRRGIVMGHGYGGVTAPHLSFQPPETVIFQPCLRGISQSRCKDIPERPEEHVLHGITSRETYIHGFNVDDLWLAVSALLECFPQTAGRIGFSGISFSGGIGALALPWDHRVQRAHLNVPSFGNHPLRVKLRNIGSAAAVAEYVRKQPETLHTLAYFDAAVAARYIRTPMHCALALFDPAVPPPGQFAIYNALPEAARLFILEAGHFGFAKQTQQENALNAQLLRFFGEL